LTLSRCFAPHRPSGRAGSQGLPGRCQLTPVRRRGSTWSARSARGMMLRPLQGPAQARLAGSSSSARRYRECGDWSPRLPSSASRSMTASSGGAPCGITLVTTHWGTTPRPQTSTRYRCLSWATAWACRPGSGHSGARVASRSISIRWARTPRKSTKTRPVHATSA